MQIRQTVQLKLDPEHNRGGTLFGLYRSSFWDFARTRLAEAEKKQDPEANKRSQILKNWLSDFRRMDFIILLSLIPIDATREDWNAIPGSSSLGFLLDKIDALEKQFGYLLANY